ncbi:MAG: MarR family winged helix-turn-helix transcriptional regulator [Hyphomicrobiaceae bacterium]
MIAKALEGSELTSRQLVVLKAVGEAKSLSQNDIVQDTGIDRSTVADIVRRLVERKLLVRERTKQDARAYAVETTPAGAELLRAAMPLEAGCEARMLAALLPKDRRSFTFALDAIVNAYGPIDSARVTRKSKR